MNPPTNKIANKLCVVYCRVSTREQVEEGNSLSTQEKVCKEYADKNSYTIAKLFVEQGESAKTADRTELQKLLAYCSDKKNRISAVVIYKLDRLSRNTDDYSQIRLLLKRYGVEIKSVSEYFENTPSGRFMENMMANVAQFDNDVRAERSTGGMRNAVREGRYVWNASVGYKNGRIAGKANLIQDEIMAPMVLRTFELIAKGTHYLEDVRKIMEKEGLRLPNGKPVSKPYFYEMIKNKIYTGIIEKFGEAHKGMFKPIVPIELFEQVQRIIKNKGRNTAEYKSDNPDFPLRRFVRSPEGLKLTGSWSKGNGGKYPFYRFGGKGSNYKKTEFEKRFREFVDDYAFREDLVEKLKKSIRKNWTIKTADKDKEANHLNSLVKELTDRQTALVQKNLSGVIKDDLLKQQLDLIDKEITETEIALAGIKVTNLDVEGAIQFVTDYLINPSATWEKAKLPTRIKLQWFQFPLGIVFNGEKFGTTKIANVFQAKQLIASGNSIRVDPGRIELPYPHCK